MSIPYLPLYVADYEADTAHLTLEEDGAYTRLLRLCWRTPGCSIPDDAEWIMRRMRCDLETYQRVVKPVLDEFFRRSKGRLFSPRLSSEHARIEHTAQKRREAGRKGGRPAQRIENKGNEQKAGLSKRKAKQKQPEPELEPDIYTPHKPPKGGGDFGAWWDVYPRKVGKREAEKIYLRLLSKSEATEEELMAGVKRYAIACAGKDPQYIAHPRTWLNQGRWADEPPPSRPAEPPIDYMAIVRGRR